MGRSIFGSTPANSRARHTATQSQDFTAPHRTPCSWSLDQYPRRRNARPPNHAYLPKPSPHPSADASATAFGRSGSDRAITKKLPTLHLPRATAGCCTSFPIRSVRTRPKARKKMIHLRTRKIDPKRSPEHHRRAGHHHCGVPSQTRGRPVSEGLSKRAMASPAARPTRTLAAISSANWFQFRFSGSSAVTSRTCSRAARRACTSLAQLAQPDTCRRNAPAVPRSQIVRRPSAPIGLGWDVSSDLLPERPAAPVHVAAKLDARIRDVRPYRGFRTVHLLGHFIGGQAFHVAQQQCGSFALRQTLSAPAPDTPDARYAARPAQDSPKAHSADQPDCRSRKN